MESDINAVINTNGATALIQASYDGDSDRVYSLIQKGADLNSQDKAGNTPLMRAALQGHTDIALALIQAGAKLDLKGKNGHTALMRAAEKGHTDILIFLIKTGANLDLQNNFGMSALMFAVKNGKKMELVEILIQAGANCDLKNNYGSSLITITEKYTPECAPNMKTLLTRKEVLQFQSKMFDILKSLIFDEPKTNTRPTFLDLPMEVKALILSYMDYPASYQHRVARDLNMVSRKVGQMLTNRQEADEDKTEEKKEHKAKM